jgi:hypothetical protein
MSSTTESQIKYAGDGVQVLFTFPFTYLQPTDIYVSLYNETERRWDDTTEWTFANATTIQFTTAPPTATGEVTDNIRIQRRTSVDPLVAQFNPGSAIRASDLNDDFEQLQLAVIDSNSIITNTDVGVTSIIAGEGISVDQAVGNVTITNTKPSDVLSVNGQTGVVALDINDLTDVVTEGAGHVPVEGQALVWSQSMGHWMPGNVAPEIGGIIYKGLIDFTGSVPSNSSEGDLWINTTEGVAGSTWTGIAGEAVTIGERAIYDGSTWDLAPVQPNAVNSVNSLTGDVVIGVEQLSDFAYNGQAPITTGQALIYDQTTEKWSPEDIAAELNISALPTLP